MKVFFLEFIACKRDRSHFGISERLQVFRGLPTFPPAWVNGFQSNACFAM